MHKKYRLDKRHPAELVGVDGWLAVLCLFLFCLLPGVIFYGDIRFLRIVLNLDSPLTTKASAVVIGVISIDCLRAVLAMLAAIALWRVWRHAVLFAQLVLFSGPVVYCLDMWLLHSGVEAQTLRRTFPIAWIAYLEGSRRVRITFGLVHGGDTKLSLLDYLNGPLKWSSSPRG